VLNITDIKYINEYHCIFLDPDIILKPGQVNYLLNHLGLGDNATFLAIKAVYKVF
jgi:hypothetical protein